MKILITGGGGFLGSEIVRQLLPEGHSLTIMARSRYPSIEALGVKCIQADIQNKDGLVDYLEGIDVVIHTAAKAGVWGSRESYFGINLEGTRNVLTAAQAAGVKAFVHCSSPSAVWSGKDESGLSEKECPYPNQYLAHYPESKAAAEKLVLAANTAEFKTTALRPHLIWGAGDPHLVPRLIDRHNRLRIIGHGRNKVGLTHVSNAAHAHVLAMNELLNGGKNAGKVYFITDPNAVVIWDWVNAVFSELGKTPITRQISAKTAARIGGILEWLWRTFGISGEPPMTRFVAGQLSTDHYYDLSAAINDFGYAPHPDSEKGWDEMIAHFNKG